MFDSFFIKFLIQVFFLSHRTAEKVKIKNIGIILTEKKICEVAVFFINYFRNMKKGILR